MRNGYQWYALMTQSQRETRVRQELLRQARIDDLPVGRVVIARAPVRVRKNGKVKSGVFTENRKAFPNYLLVQMEYTADTDRLIARCGRYGAIGLLPLKPAAGLRKDPKTGRAVSGRLKKGEREDLMDWKPVPVDDDEVARVLKADTERRRGKKPVEVTVVPGDQVSIVGGPYRRMDGEVKGVDTADPTDPKVLVTVELIGRPVDVCVRWRDVAPLG